MSGYSDYANEQDQREWIGKWVPADDKLMADCPKSFREQYRFTLARARSAEDDVQTLRRGLASFRDLLRRVDRMGR